MRNLKSSVIGADEFNTFRQEMEKKLEEKEKEATFEKENQFKQIDNLMKRIYLLENKYQEQQTVIATQQAEISNKIKFGSDFHVAGEDIVTRDIISSLDTDMVRDS